MTLLARIISAVFAVLAGIIVLGIALYILPANPDNQVVEWLLNAAAYLVTPFRQLFDFDNNNIQVALNWGIGAVVYLAVGTILTKLIGGLGRSAKS